MAKINLDTESKEMAESANTAPQDQTPILEAQIVDLTNDLQRTRADFENFRKQVEVQKTQTANSYREATVVKFLALIDDFDRAISSYPEQLAPLQKSFEKTLTGLGLEKVNTNSGTEFNPDLHEAVSVVDGEGEVEVIDETLRPGYLYEGRVIRPAMVKVKHLDNKATNP